MKSLVKSSICIVIILLIFACSACSPVDMVSQSHGEATPLQIESDAFREMKMITAIDGIMGRATAYTEDGMPRQNNHSQSCISRSLMQCWQPTGSPEPCHV